MTGQDRCGYVHNSGWGRDNCCWRPTWGERDRCFWHAPETGKPTERIESTLTRERSTDRQLPGSGCTLRLDGAVLTETILTAETQFDDCGLAGADFSGADVPWSDHPELEMPWAPYTDDDISAPSFRNTDLRGASLTEADFPEADLQNADLRGAILDNIGLADAQLTDANLRNATLQGAYLGNATLDDAILLETDFTAATLSRASLLGAFAERAIFTRADLVQADLRGVALSAAVFTDARITAHTNFGDYCVYDHRSAFDLPENPLADELAQGYERDTYVKAEWTYQRLHGLCTQNRLVEHARRYYVLGKDMNRARYWDRSLLSHLWRRLTGPGNGHEEASNVAGNDSQFTQNSSEMPDERLSSTQLSRVRATGTWGRAAVSGAVMRYGNSPTRVVGISLLVVALFAIIYPLYGLQTTTGTITYPTGGLSLSLPTEVSHVLAESFIYSLAVFTTIGSGSMTPTGVSRALTAAESLLGALLVALLVFVLGRRATL